MNFTDEEIKEGEELIESMWIPFATYKTESIYKSATECAIIAQKMKVEEIESICYGRKPENEPILFIRRYHAKRILQYLESL